MELIKEIGKDQFKSEPRIRKSARAIILSEDNKIALMHVSKRDYYKLPGGGLNDSEDVESALKREVKEEVGCDIEIIESLGKVVENKIDINTKSVSECFVCKLLELGQNSLTKHEQNDGFEVIWNNVDEAIENLKNSNVDNYHAKFIIERELVYLEEYKRLMS